MFNGLCMNCFGVKGKFEVCPHCGHIEGTPPKEPYHLMPGTTLDNGKYIIGMSIGTGGFGIIYKAYDTVLGVIVAIKEFYPEGLVNRAPGTMKVGLLSGDKEAEFRKNKQDFLMEAQMIGKFGKTNDIVKVYTCFEANATAYIVMEYMDGILLKDVFGQRGRFEPEEAVTLTLGIIEAVKKVHTQGMIHRDISPDNIFWMDSGIKLFDFGSAMLAEPNKEVEIQAVVKPGYTPPEQYRKKGKQGFYTDIYAIGAMLYEMLTGERPIEASERAVKDQLKKPSELGIVLEPNVERALMKALAVDVQYRFQKIEHFQEALNNRRAAEFPEVEKRKQKRRRNIVAAVSMLVIAAFAMGIGVFVQTMKSSPLNAELERDSIAVWVPVEKMPDSGELEITAENIDEDYSGQKDYIRQYRFYDLAEIAKTFLQDKEFPDNGNITINIVPVPESDYNQAYEEAVEDDSDAYVQPTLFLTEGLSADQRSTYEDLTPLYKDLELNEYFFLPDYKEMFPDVLEIPTGFDTLFLYTRLQVNKEDTSLADVLGTNDLEEMPKSVDIRQVLNAAGGVKNLKNYVGWQDTQFANTLYLLEPSMASQDGLSFSDDLALDVNTMYEMQQAVVEKHGNSMGNWFDSYDSNLAGIIADSTLLRSDVITQARGNYAVSLLVCGTGKDNARTMVTLKDMYAVNKEAGKNQKNAAMRLLAYLLTENAQNLNCQQHKRALPLRRDVYANYMESEVKFKEVLYDPMRNLGTDFDTIVKTGDAQQILYLYNRDLKTNIFEEKGLESEEIQKILKEYE